MKYLWIPALLAACGGDDTDTDTTVDTTTPTAPEPTATGRWIGTCVYDPPDVTTGVGYAFDFDSVFTLIESDDGSIAGTWTITLVLAGPTTTGTFGTLAAAVVGERVDDQVSLATTELYGYGLGYTTTTGDLPSFDFDLVLADDALSGEMVIFYGTEPAFAYICDLAR